MPTPREILVASATDVPCWLAGFGPDDAFPCRAFFESRVVYYPGSGTDGHPLRTFGGAHAAHAFLFADYGIAEATVRRQLAHPDDPGHPRGYRSVAVRSVREHELTPHGWRPHPEMLPGPVPRAAAQRPEGGAYAVGAILERREEFGDDHGPSRIAMICIAGEAVATFDALFCQRNGIPAPFGILLQDHGFGGNWTRFGGDDSPLWRLARAFARPEWLLVGDNTDPWPGYVRLSGGDPGGMHGIPRYLYRWAGDCPLARHVGEHGLLQGSQREADA